MLPISKKTPMKKIEKCKYLISVPQKEGCPLCKCIAYNNKQLKCYRMIKEKLNDIYVIPNGDCPYAYRGLPYSECPCFEKK